MTTERAETGRLETLLAQIGAGLDAYLRFEHLDQVDALVDSVVRIGNELDAEPYQRIEGNRP
jgi:hypothetical protein